MAMKAEEVLAIVLAKIKGGGTGEGDMKKSDYDPDHVVQTAGGITEYVDDEITDLQLGTASKKNSTAVVAQGSTDLVESGAVCRAIGIDFKNFCSIARVKRGDGEARRVEYNIEPIPQGTYIFSSTISGNASSYGFDFRNANSEQIATVGTGEFTSKEITFTEEVSKLYTYISENDYNNGRYLLVDNIMVSKDGGAYEPYHASVEDTLRDAEVVQGKNLLTLPYNVSNTINGLTFTVNDDNSITVNGTATANTDYVVNDWQKNQNTFDNVKNQRVILSGCPSGGSANTYSIYGYRVGGATINARDTGNGDTFVFRNDNTVWNIAISIKSGIVLNNLTFYPMLRTATETDPTYEPYYTPLKDVVPTKADNSVIAPVENGSTASQAYAVGSHFIRNGAFCTVTSAISSGESLVGSSKFTSGDVADELETVDITNEFTFSTDCTWSSGRNTILKYGNVIEVNLRFDTPSTVTNDKYIVNIPAKYRPKNVSALSPLIKTWSGNIIGIIAFSVDLTAIELASNTWTPSENGFAHFTYLI